MLENYSVRFCWHGVAMDDFYFLKRKEYPDIKRDVEKQ